MLLVFMALWICFAGEMFLRAFDPQPMLPRYVQAGDFGIRVNMPNQVYVHKTPEYRVEIRTNNRGMRANVDYTYEKPAGVKRVVVLGDSFGMGYGVKLEDTFTEQMRRKLESSLGKKVEIINLSVSGYGTAEELLMLQHEGVRYHPDLVLLAWHATDPDDNLRSGLFAVEHGKLVRRNATYLPGVKIREYLFSFAIYRWLAGNSHFYNWLRDFAGSKIKQVMATMKRTKVDSASNDSVSSKEGPDYSLSIALLDAVKLETEKAGAKLLLLEIPVRVSRTEYLPCMPEEIRRRFDVVSPIKVFQQHAGSLLYWEKSHGHFTPLGCEIVAGSLAEAATKMLATQSGNSEGI